MIRPKPCGFGGYDSAFTGMHEDQVFFSRLMLSFPIVVIDDVLHRYRLPGFLRGHHAPAGS